MPAMGGLPERESGLAGNIDIAQLDDGNCKRARVRQGKVGAGHGWAIFAFAPVHRDGGRDEYARTMTAAAGKMERTSGRVSPGASVHIPVIAHQPKTISLPDKIPGPIALSYRCVCSLLVFLAGTASQSPGNPVWPVCRRFSETNGSPARTRRSGDQAQS